MASTLTRFEIMERSNYSTLSAVCWKIRHDLSRKCVLVRYKSVTGNLHDFHVSMCLFSLMHRTLMSYPHIYPTCVVARKDAGRITGRFERAWVRFVS